MGCSENKGSDGGREYEKQRLRVVQLQLPGWTDRNGDLQEQSRGRSELEQLRENFGFHSASSLKELGNPDLVLLPDTATPLADLQWMRDNGLAAALKELAEEEVPIWGTGGGYLMLGEVLVSQETEPDLWIEPEQKTKLDQNVEPKQNTKSEQNTEIRVQGLGFLPLLCYSAAKRPRTAPTVFGAFTDTEGIFSDLQGLEFTGRDCQAGMVRINRENGLMDTGRMLHGHLEICRPLSFILNQSEAEKGGLSKQMRADGYSRGNCYGSMVDGILDCENVLMCMLRTLENHGEREACE